MTAAAHVCVVVPARDEAGHLDALVSSLAAARAAVAPVPVSVTVVLDSCTDASAHVLARHPWVRTATVTAGSVGVARRHGVEHSRPVDLPADRVWIACTDADGTVPPHWLASQLEAAGAGADLVVGTVRPEPGEAGPRLLRSWRSRHHLRDDHPHVHGANLGIRLSAYDALGGFDPVTTGEDVLLVQRARRSGLVCAATDRAPVTTSARRHGRAPLGFAAWLLALEATLGEEAGRGSA